MPKHKKLQNTLKNQTTNLLKKSTLFSKYSLLNLRPLSKEEKFKFAQLSKYLYSKDAKVVQNYIKQRRARIDIKKIGLSFMMANSDLQPYLNSELEVLQKINELITKKFQKKLEDEFTIRAWQMIQEYVGGNILGMRNIKKLLTLMLFSDKININISKIKVEDEQILKKNYKLLGYNINTVFNSKSRNFDFTIIADAFDSNKFIKMAEKIISKEKYEPNKTDTKFIKKYIQRARKIEPQLNPLLSDKVKEFIIKLKNKDKKLPYCVKENTIESIMSLLKASARIDLREQIGAKDLDRVFSILK
jgi:DNA replicative helicase MCM subunit Mcm2 (Cdc46/Mcm family)